MNLKKWLLVAALAAQVPHAAGLFHLLVPLTANPYLEWLTWGHALVYALALEGAIYYFVQQGKLKLSTIFAVASVATNVLYYWQEGMGAVYIARFALISLSLPFAIACYSHEMLSVPLEVLKRTLEELRGKLAMSEAALGEYRQLASSLESKYNQVSDTLTQVRSQLDQALSALSQTRDELESRKEEWQNERANYQASLESAYDELTITQEELHTLQAQHMALLSEQLTVSVPSDTGTCPYCGKDDFSSPQARGGHVGKCSMRPEKQNGHFALPVERH